MADQKTVVKYAFKPSEYEDLLAILRAKNLLVEIDGIVQGVVDTKKEFPNAPNNLFHDAYAYIANIIAKSAIGATGTPAETQTQFWFSKAPAVNRGDADNPANWWIRGVTQWAFLQSGKLGGMTQEQINVGVQTTSNMIAEGVMNELIANKGVPDFGTLIANDINAAIGEKAPLKFRQDAGGWAGAFYYWNAPLRRNGATSRSVGDAILKGDPEHPDQKKPSDLEFFYANSNGMADFFLAHDRVALKIDSTENILKGLKASVIPFAQQIKNLKDSIEGGMGARAPFAVKAQIYFDYVDVIWGRALSGHYRPGPLVPGGEDQLIVVTSKGTEVTTTYADKGAYTASFGGEIGYPIKWTRGNTSGTVKVLQDFSSIIFGLLFSGETEASYVSPELEFKYIRGAVGELVSVSETAIYAGKGRDTIIFPTIMAGTTQTIYDADNLADIYVGETKIDAAGTKIPTGLYTWIDGAGIKYEFDPLGKRSMTGTMLLSGGALGDGQLKINRFDLGETLSAQADATGFHGILLPRTDQMVMCKIAAMPTNPFNSATFNSKDAPTPTSIMKEGGIGTFAIYLPYGAGEGGQKIKVELEGSIADNFLIQIGDQVVQPQNGSFTLDVAAGREEITFTLLHQDDLTVDAEINIFATLLGSSGGQTFEKHLLDKLTVKADKDWGEVASVVVLKVKDGKGTYRGDGVGNTRIVGTSVFDRIEADSGGGPLFVIEGNLGHDVITGGAVSNRIYADKEITVTDALKFAAPATGQRGSWLTGGVGDSLIVGSGGNDDVLMGNGNDTIIAGNGNNIIKGATDWRPADDWNVTRDANGYLTFLDLQYKSASNLEASRVIHAGHGDNWINTRHGETYVMVGDGDNTVIGGTGDNNIVLGDGNNDVTANFTGLIEGNKSQNYIQAGNGNNTIMGGGGDSTIIVGSGDNLLWGLDGNDYIEVSGGAGNNEIQGHEGDNTIIGGAGITRIKAGGGNNDIILGEGETEVVLGDGVNYVYGGDADYKVKVGKGDNDISLGKGKDYIQAGDGNNVLDAGDGVNDIRAGNGNNEIWGGSGNDYIQVGTGNNTIYGGGGSDSIHGGSGANVIYAGEGGTADHPTLLLAGDGATTVYGGSGVNHILGGSGAAVLHAGSGGTKDHPTVLQAGKGPNTLVAGNGVSKLIGGQNTKFVLAAGSGSTEIISGGGQQVFEIEGELSPAEMMLTAELYSDRSTGLVLNFGGRSVTITGGLNGAADTVSFKQGGSLNLSQLMQTGYVLEQKLAGVGFDMELSKTAGALLEGTTSDSSLYAFGEGSRLTGSAGTAMLAGGGGKSTYVVNPAAMTTVSNSRVTDAIEFGAGVTSENLFAVKTEVNGKPVITISFGKQAGATGKLVVDGTRAAELLDIVTYADGSSTTLTDLIAQSSGGTGTTTRADGSFYTISGDAQGNTKTTQFDAHGYKLSDTWKKADGSYGSATYKADGAYSSTAFAIGGARTDAHNDGQGNTKSITFTGGGVKSGDSWTKADGSYGSNLYAADGTSSGTLHFTDGTYSTFVNDGKGGVRTVSYNAQGVITGQTDTTDTSAAHTVTTDATGTATTTYFDNKGVKLSDNWVKPDGSFGSDNFRSDGTSSGISYRPDGSFATYVNDGDGQVISTNYGWDGVLKGSVWTQINGRNNTISSVLNANGAKLSETWIHADGRTGSNVLGNDDYYGFTSMSALQWDAVQVLSYFETEEPYYYDAYRKSYVEGENKVFQFDTNISTANVQSNMYYVAERWDGEFRFDLRLRDFEHDVKFNVDSWAGQWELSNGNGEVLPGFDPKKALSMTATGEDGASGLFKQDGLGNVEVTVRDSFGAKIQEQWVHNDGAIGHDIFRPDGSSYGYFSSARGETGRYSDDGRGNVVTHFSKGDVFERAAYVAPPTIVMPVKLAMLSGPPSGHPGGYLPQIHSSGDGKGGEIITFFNPDGSVEYIHLDAFGNAVTATGVQTDPEVDAAVIVDGVKSSWRYTLAGSLFSHSIDDGKGAVTTEDYDTSGRLSGTSLATKDAAGAITTRTYDAHGRSTGWTVALPAVDGRVDKTIYSALGKQIGNSFTITDADGNRVSSTYNAAGVMTSASTMQVTDSRAVTMGFYDGNGVPTSAITTRTTEDGAIHTSTYDAAGKLVGTVVALSDKIGNVKTSTYGADGIITGYITLAAGTDGVTNISAFDADGILRRSESLALNGDQVNSVFHPDGASEVTTRHLNGTYSVVTADGMGNATTAAFNAARVKTGASWVSADGGKGTDIVNADGSGSGKASYADGTASSYVRSASGQTTTTRFGSDGVTVIGSTVLALTQGMKVTTTYNAGGTKLSAAWIAADGTSGRDVFNADGTSAGTRTSVDGSYSTYTKNGHGGVTVLRFDRNGDPVEGGLVNQAPVVKTLIGDLSASESQAFKFVVPGSTFSDPNAADLLSYTATLDDGKSLPAWLAWDPATVTFSGTPADADKGAIRIRVSARDPGGLSVSTSFALTVNNVNNAPLVKGRLTDASVDERSAFSIAIPPGTFIDPDAGDVLAYSVTLADGRGAPAWLICDPATGALSGTSADAGSITLRVIATDAEGLSASAELNLTVRDVNRAPVASNVIAAHTTLEAGRYEFIIPGVVFTDPDGDILALRMAQANGSELPAWLSFDAASATLSGTPGDADVGKLDLRLTAADGAGLEASTQFALTVNNVNQSPRAVGPLADVVLIEGTAQSFAFPHSMFTDPDAGDILTLSASLINGEPLPSWLHIDLEKLQGMAVPQASNIGTVTARITATDSAGATSSVNFNVTVEGAGGQTLTGTSGPDTLSGLSGADLLQGLAGNDRLIGNAGNDTLDGGAGIDTAVGGAGNDTYVVDNAADVITETAGQGDDRVKSSVSYVLPGEVERLELTGTAALNGTGNGLDNILIGNAANNVLDGGAGADAMAGGLQADIYVVDNPGDVVVENLGEGTDTVRSSMSYITPAHVENLTLTGAAAINGTGNGLGNILNGNDGANLLSGQDGNDTFNGGGGVDTLAGGAGNDSYVIDATGDAIVENVGEGLDWVYASVDYTLGADVEYLTLTGSAHLSGTGNTLSNLIIGNSGNNILTGGAGNDTITGGAGIDTLAGGVGSDSYIVQDETESLLENAAEGTDLVTASVSFVLPAHVENLTLSGAAGLNATGNELGNTLRGNGAANTLFGLQGDDWLVGGLGEDTMTGGAGSDVYVVEDAGDEIVELEGEGNDLVRTTLSYALPAHVEQLTLAGNADVNATGNVLDNVLTGNAGKHRLIGGDGNDTLIAGTGAATLMGGAGNNAFYVNKASDVVVAEADGINSIVATASYVMPANVHNLTLAGPGAFTVTGNELANTILGNLQGNVINGGAGDDVLDGRSGDDTLIGGSGNVTFIVDSAGDVVQAQAGGINTVVSSVSMTLPVNVTNLVAPGSYGLYITGNSGNNFIKGSTGTDTITGTGGVDVLDGGAGNDDISTSTKGALIGAAGNDRISAGSMTNFIAGGAGNDVISIGTSASVVAFNSGDGQDKIITTAGGLGVLSLGGGIAYDQLALKRNANDLILSTGGTDSVTLQNWYASAGQRNFVTLQMVQAASQTYDPASGNPLYNKKVVQFDFAKLVGEFEKATAGSPVMTSDGWKVMDRLLGAHLQGSDTAARGGQLAYSYGSGANFSGVDMLAAAVAMEEGKISASSA